MTLLSETVKEIDLEALVDVLDYFNKREDAEYHTDSAQPTPNEEMRHAMTVDAALAELTTRRARDAEVAEMAMALAEIVRSDDNQALTDSEIARGRRAFIAFTGAKP